MFKKNNFENQYPPMQNNSGMYPNMEFNRLLYEIKENRRRINNLAKRISRIESYLRIKDNPEYGYIEENNPNDFSF